MNKTVLAAVVALCLFALIEPLRAATFEAQKGDRWLGGNFCFMSTGMRRSTSDYRQPRRNLVTFSPIARFFPLNHLTVGPKLAWEGMFTDGYAINWGGIGAEAGFVCGERHLPYLISSPQIAFQCELHARPEISYTLPFTAGIMVPLADMIGLQFEACLHLCFHRHTIANTFSIGIGICGFGKRTAVSLVNVLNSYNSYFGYLFL
jgi:hypothetical protein